MTDPANSMDQPPEPTSLDAFDEALTDPAPEQAPEPEVDVVSGGKKETAKEPQKHGKRPAVILSKNIVTFGIELAKQLVQVGAPIYFRNGVAISTDAAGKAIEELSFKRLCTWANKHVDIFSKIVTKGVDGEPGSTSLVPASIPKSVTEQLVVSDQFLLGLRPLENIHPDPRPLYRDGKALALLTKGYDHTSKTLTIGNLQIDTTMTVEAAVALLRHWTREFLGLDKEHTTACIVGAMLTAWARLLLPHGARVPGLCINANAKQAGKGTLLELILWVIAGNAEVSEAPTEKEINHRIFRALTRGDDYLVCDDVPEGSPFDLQAVKVLMTAPIAQARMSHSNKAKDYASGRPPMVLVTGINVTMPSDMTRRFIWVDLLKDESRQDHFENSADMVGERLLEERPKLLSALWALVREWDRKDRPGGSIYSQDHPHWATIIGGMLETNGFSNPLARKAPQLENAGDETEANKNALALWCAQNKEGVDMTSGEMRQACVTKEIWMEIHGGQPQCGNASALGKLSKKISSIFARQGHSATKWLPTGPDEKLEEWHWVATGKNNERRYRISRATPAGTPKPEPEKAKAPEPSPVEAEVERLKAQLFQTTQQLAAARYDRNKQREFTSPALDQLPKQITAQGSADLSI